MSFVVELREAMTVIQEVKALIAVLRELRSELEAPVAPVETPKEPTPE